MPFAIVSALLPWGVTIAGTQDYGFKDPAASN